MNLNKIFNRRLYMLLSALVVGVLTIFFVVESSPTLNAAPSPGNDYDLIASGDATGLYRTGVDSSNNKIGGNKDDPHWIIDRVFNTVSKPTCQYAYGDSGLIEIPWSSSPTNISARTVTEYSSTNVGKYQNDKNITGGIYSFPARLLGTSPWKVVLQNAMWIGQNQFGQNYSKNNCKDPTYNPPRDIWRANTYVFKLKDGFNIDSSVDKSTISLTLRAFVDDEIQVFVNGSLIKARRINSSGVPIDNFSDQPLSPGFGLDASSIETEPIPNLKTGPGAGNRNELEIHVRSRYSHTGLMISDIKLYGAQPYEYTLSPHVVTSSPSNVLEPGSSYSVTPSVTNSGPTKSNNTQWQLTKIIVQPNNVIPNLSGGESNSLPCVYFNGVGSSCTVIDSAPANNIFDVGTNTLANYPDSFGDFVIGTKICYAFSVQPHSSSDNQWAHSAPTCLIIGKKPKVQIWAGDLWSRGLVQTSTSIKGNITFGSWVEYSIFANGLIKGTASGSAFAGAGLASADVSGCNYSTLSFTNAGSSTCGSAGSTIGNYITSRSIPDVVASFPGAGTAISGTVVPNDLPKNSPSSIVDVYSASDLTLNGSTLVPAKSIIIKATGTVTINGDQRYTNGPYINISQLPQLVIIANKIVINSSVTNVDAWLVAKNTESTGEIDTCEVIGDTSDKCNLQLTINGPVIANKLDLRRTAGSGIGAASGDPAEVINLRADAYLWASARAIDGGHIQTVYVTELPPRF